MSIQCLIMNNVYYLLVLIAAIIPIVTASPTNQTAPYSRTDRCSQ